MKKRKTCKPVKAWARTFNGEFCDTFHDGVPMCYRAREFGKTTGHTWVRVEIREIRKARKGGGK